MRNKSMIMAATALLLLTASCAGSSSASMEGGELTGGGSQAFNEPTPYGMVLIQRGSLRLGEEETDSLWGSSTPNREISVESFWMDDTEITNAEYKQFIYWVRDSIIRERLADPSFGGDETYKIEEDKDGEPLDKPYLNWKKTIPWRKPTEDQNQDQNRNQDQNDDRNDNQDQPQQQPQAQEQKLSSQQAQQMLRAVQAQERKTQEKVNKEKAELLKSSQKEKNW